jgi:hypothetical protein
MKKNYLFKKISIQSVFILVVVLLVPMIAFADTPTVILDIVGFADVIIKAIFPILTALGILAFGYNIGKYLTSKDIVDQNVYKAGILNSLFALFIMFVIVGLITVLANSLGIPSLGLDISVADKSGLVGGSGGIGTFRNYALGIARFLTQRIIPILIACALMFFLGNLVISMTKSNVEAERTKMNDYLKWGILALFVLLTLFSIIGMVTGSLFGTGAIIPQFQTTE